MRIKHYGRFFVSLLMLALLAFAAGTMAYRMWFVKETAYAVTYDTLDIDKTYKAVIFRRETIVHTNVGGSVAYAVQEGVRIKRGEKIMEIKSDGQVSEIKKDSDSLTSTKIDEMLTVDLDNVNAEIAALSKSIFDEAALENFGRVAELRRDLLLKLDKKKKLMDNKSLLRKGASSFKQAYVGSIEAIEGDLVEFFSQDAGIVTFTSDGLEQTITLENLYNIDYTKLLGAGTTTVKDLTTHQIQAGGSVYRLIDTSTWFLAAQISKEEIDLYEKDKVIDVEFDGTKIIGSIADVFESGGEGVLVIKINELHPSFYSKRFVDARIVRENFQGLKVRKDSIVTLNGTTGVFVLDIDRRALFRPVKILGYNENFAVVKDGYLSVNSEEGPTRVKTLEVRNLILIDPIGVKTGDKFEQR
jgi:putative membrane fusion protein